jgi:lipopolysaccharide heptosyltransferase II
MNPISEWNSLRNILAVRLDSMGDVLMTTPALRALKARPQDRQLTLLTSSQGAAVAPLLPMLDRTIAYDAPWIKSTMLPPSPCHELKLIEQLRSLQFDGAVVFTVYSQSPLPAAMLCYLAGIPYRLAHARENPYWLLTHWVRETEPDRMIRHEAKRQLELVETIGSITDDWRLTVDVRREVRAAMAARLAVEGLDAARPWIVVHPGASAPSRRYPFESFAAVARELVLDNDYQLVFTGSAGEVALIDAILDIAAVPAISLAGQTNLEELAAVLSLCSLLISNNTGPVHLAAAVGTPVVDLYALTNPQHSPWCVPHELLFHDVPCKNCYKSVCPEEHHHCLRLVPPAAVVNAVYRLLSNCVAGRQTLGSDANLDGKLTGYAYSGNQCSLS